MATTRKSNKTNKTILLSNKEKEILTVLHELYANDFKKYGEHIKRESNIPTSIKNIYNSLDQRQAYQRVFNYFQKQKTRLRTSSRSNHLKKPSRSSIRNRAQIDEPMSITQSDSESDDNDQQESNSSIMENHMNETNEYQHVTTNNDNDVQEIEVSENNSIHQEKQTLPLTNNGHNESMFIPHSQTSTNLTFDLLSIRTNIQQALHELDRAILESESITKDSNNKQQQRLLIRNNNFLTNTYDNRKLDDIVRSLSNVVNQQQENVHLILNESSSLLSNENNKRLENISTTKQQSITHILQRLNTLVDRGNSIYDKLEKILSEF
ncbi:unnamed protein product [Rotaria sordida]|uniref:Uncharacterized protein n=1 Tax=Rotaria sordida TaxID=392033 RepID=A0A813S148_9BILA|nr:unnamed protein product [Rotaria sordida]CAF0788064.1 unnamed protein product [Rotaria sordida]